MFNINHIEDITNFSLLLSDLILFLSSSNNLIIFPFNPSNFSLIVGFLLSFSILPINLIPDFFMMIGFEGLYDYIFYKHYHSLHIIIYFNIFIIKILHRCNGEYFVFI